jgi:polysaccharide biosynthesis transport protein
MNIEEKEQVKTLQDYMAMFSRRKIPMVITVMIVFLIGIVVALVWPPTYKSSATILIKEQEIPAELVMSTVTSFAAQRIQTISQRVMTRTNLMQIIKKYNLYKDDLKRYTTEEVLEEMREDIELNMISADMVDPRTGRPTSATIAFSLSYQGKFPGSTQKVAGELTSLFLAENLKNRKEKASETYLFLTSESEKLAEMIASTETKMAAFKEQHVGSMPDMASMNLSVLDRTERELMQIEVDLSARKEKVFYLDSQLAQTNPLTNMRSATGQSILDPVSRLKALESEYASLTAKYSSQHPDVIKMSREIKGLQEQTGTTESTAEKAKHLTELRADLAVLTKKYSSTHPDVLKLNKSVKALEKNIKSAGKLPEQKVMELQPDNPLYITLQGQVKGVETEIRGLSKRKKLLRSKVEEVEKRIALSPQVEREYLVMSREHVNALARFQEIKAKQMAAEIGQKLEKESKGESFLLIEPAQFPEKPVKPNRPAIVFLSLIFSFACGFGIAVFQEALDSSIRGISGVTKLLTSTPLAVIPVIYNAQDYYRKRRATRIVVSSVVTSIIVVVLVVHFFWTPLDVLWFKSIRKAENALGV